MTRPLSNINLAMNRAGGSGDAFSPASIAGLRIWLDAQDDAQLTVIDTNKCSSWISKGGSLSLAMGVAGGAASAAPIIEDVNGLQMLQFSSARYMFVGISTDLSPGTGPMTIVTVARTVATARSEIFHLNAGGTGVIQTRFNNSVSDGTYVGQMRDSAGGINRMLWVDSDVDHADGTVRVAMISRPGGGAAGAFYVNGAASSLNPIADTSGNINDNMGNFTIGRTTAGADRLVGHIGEVIVYFAELSAGDREALNTYLTAKWNL